jgi:hypothetical protein
MSNTLMVWKPQAGLTQSNAADTFEELTEGELVLKHSPALDAFLSELLIELPAPQSAEDASPWAETPAITQGYLALDISGDMIDTTCDVVVLALRHDLVVYDPQVDMLYDQAWREDCDRQDAEDRRRTGEAE